jgi:hypothetical protein
MDTWFAELAQRLPGQGPKGHAVAFETTEPCHPPLRHTLVIESGYPQAWHRDWDPETSAALRLSRPDTVALTTGTMQVWNTSIPVELVAKSAAGTWTTRPLPPFDLAGVQAALPAPPRTGEPTWSWAELQVGSPFGNLDLLWTANDNQILSVAPRPASNQPGLRMMTRYHHAIEARCRRRTWLETFEDGGWIDGPDPTVERLIDLFDRLDAQPRYTLDGPIADLLIALGDLVTGAGSDQIAALLELATAGDST